VLSACLQKAFQSTSMDAVCSNFTEGQPMTDQAPPKPKARPAKVERSTRIIVFALALLSALFTVTLLGSFSGGGRISTIFHQR
jgi:hypothetical protein